MCQAEEDSAREASGRGRSRDDEEAEEEAREKPAWIPVGQEQRPDRSRQVHGRDEGRGHTDENGRAGSPRGGHFWKKRKRLTAEGPSEKKSPDRRGRAQSSSKAPARSSGAGIGSPFK